jgi:hypothetical protein
MNFMRSLQEYNVIQHKLKARDRIKDQYDKFKEKMKKIQSDKSHPDNQTPTVQHELETRISRTIKDMEAVESDFLLQNKITYDIMCKLLLEKSKMLNPIVTKLLQIN